MKRLFRLIARLVMLQASAVLFVPEEAEAEAVGERQIRADSGGEADPNGTRIPAREMLAPLSTFVDCKDGCPAMVVVSAGKFIMDPDQYLRERPQHTVTFLTQFAVGKFAVTFDEWVVCAKVAAARATLIRRMRGGDEERIPS